MKLITVLGTRPQYIKYYPLHKYLKESFDEVLVDTNQHYDRNMSAVFFDELGLKTPDYNIGAQSGSHGQQLAFMLPRIEQILQDEKPDGVLVFGDTNSTLAGALMGARHGIPVFHVEAGLRSYNRRMPEEQNRVMTDYLSTLLFCPSENAVKNLEKEGLRKGIHIVGDIQCDATLRGIERAKASSDVLHRLKLEDVVFNLMTVHRAENTSHKETLNSILYAVGNSGVHTVFPMHPRTMKVIRELAIEIPDNILFIEPQGYLDFLMLIKYADRIVTDSGGIQKEAYYLGTPCIIIRRETEWTELTDGGFNLLAGIEYEHIYDGIVNFTPREIDTRLYGDGDSAMKIVALIQEYFAANQR